MIVLDASAAVDWLLQTSAGHSIENRIYSTNETLHAPHLLDLEVAQVLRRLARQGVVSIHRADEAVRDLLDLRITRYPHLVLLPRITRGYVGYTGSSTRFCFWPCRSRRALLIRRVASSTHPLIVDRRGTPRP